MIKTKSFVSNFVFLFLCVILVTPVYAQHQLGEITLQGNNRQELKVSNLPELYLPSRLVLGEKNKLIVKGEAGKTVSLAVSSSNSGSLPLLGNKLRLGETEMTVEGVIPPSGVLEMLVEIPNDDSLVDRMKYFELAVWSKEDMSDLLIAKTMSPLGKETYKNGVTVAYPPGSAKAPKFGATIPGVPSEFFTAIDRMNDVKDGKVNPELLDDGQPNALLDTTGRRDLIIENIKR